MATAGLLPTPSTWNIDYSNLGEPLSIQSTVLTDGTVMVVWVAWDGSQFSNIVQNTRVLGARFTADGTPIGGVVELNGFTNEIRVGALPTGGFVVTWSSRADGNIYQQVYDANGLPAGAETQVNTLTTGFEYDPDIIPLDDGGYLIVWDSDRTAIYFQQFDASGTMIGGQTLAPVSTANVTRGYANEPIPFVQLDDGSLATVYRDGDNMIVTTFDLDGSLRTAMTIPVSAPNGYDMKLITILEDGSVIQIWEESAGVGRSDYKAVILAADGTVLVPEFTMFADAFDDRVIDSAIRLPNGTLIVAWHDYGGKTIFGQVFDTAGVPVSEPVELTYGPALTTKTDFDVMADGNVLVTFNGMQSLGGQIIGSVFDLSQNAVVTNLTTGDDSLDAGPGDDIIDGLAGNDTVDGGAGSDVLIGGPDDDSLTGGDDPDYLAGGDGNDVLFGDAGNDLLLGGAGYDILDGGPGNDTLDGGLGNNALHGGDGDDLITAGLKYANSYTTIMLWQTITGGAGNDTITAFDSWGTIDGGPGDDWIDGAGTIEGGDGNDYIKAGMDDSFEFGPGQINGGAGDDTLNVAVLNHVDGGPGRDVLMLVDAMEVDVTAGTMREYGPYSGTNYSGTFTGIEVFRFGSSYDTTANQLRTVFHGSAGSEEIWYSGEKFYGELGGGDDFLAAYSRGVSTTRTSRYASNDTILAGAGDDTILADIANDSIDGGAGNDSLFGGRFNDTLLGGAGNDTLGGEADDDSLDGGEGDDLLLGGDGIDTLAGGLGNDAIWGGNGGDRAWGGAGNDTLGGGNGDDMLRGGDGDDEVWGGGDDDSLYGDAGNDTLGGYSGDDYLAGNAGNDELWGNTGDDTLLGGTGDDLLGGHDGADFLDGGEGHDTLGGGAGRDTLLGGLGDDALWGGGDDDIGYGGWGNDTLGGGNGNDTMYGDLGNDVVGGGYGDDQLFGDAGDDTLGGFGGDDTLDGGAGDDVLWGNTGNDSILGGDGADLLAGFHGADTLDGGAGADELRGGPGDDVLWGGSDADTFVFDWSHGNDTVKDFEDGIDVIRISSPGISTFADLSMSQVGSDVVLHLAKGDVTIENVNLGQLTDADFVLV
ncbi:calcium-binding protein [Tropicibacter sp. S64]|uniref:calcium-binding protein n=1 Tax=Tropicibacter sp. S64 TaxID=3415122 RepID=UPI003C7C2BE2